MKKNTLFILLAISLLINGQIFSQQNLTLYNMEVVPQRMYANPAFFPSYSKVNIGLPMLSSQYFNFSNSGFKYSDLVKHRSDDSLYIDYDNMLSKLKSNNYLTTAYQPDLLSFGFAIQKNYFSFNMTEKMNIRFRYPKGFMEFIGKGNGGMLGEQVNFNFGIDAIHYREYGFGYSRKINDKLTIGGKFKYLYGMENIWTEKSDISLTTNPNDFAITAQANLKINTSIDTSFGGNGFSAGKYAFGKKNRGMGIDLGGVYKLNKKFTFSGSLIDLGFIKWKQDVTTYQSANPDAKFTFKGLDMNQLINTDSSKNPTKIVTDSIIKIFKIDTIHTSYTTKLSSQLYLGANYNFTEKINTGVLFYGQFFDKKIHPALALSFNQRLGRWLNYSISYSMYNRSYNNFGLGLGLNLGPIQLYMVSDNVLGAIFPQNTKNIHLHFGVNLTFGRGKKANESKIEKSEDNKDKSTKLTSPTLKPNKKDTDGDGIPNKIDLCPKIPGTLEFKGCPDADKDHIQDKEDFCPNDSGSIELKGCPDKDGDKVSDLTDSCPDIAGLPELKGCPDKDGDGMPDKNDRCPEKFGPASNNGCPETKLNLIDSTGVTLKTAIQNTDGSFSFADSLISEEKSKFKLEGEKTDGIRDVNIMILGVAKKAIKDSVTNIFQFAQIAKLTPDKVLPEEDVLIKLDTKQAEILKKAFNNLEFSSAKDVIKPSSFESLDELFDLLYMNIGWKLKISGHTDNQGNVVTNLKLSEKRAEAVRQYLITKGISQNRFKVEWFGATKPIADNKTEEGRQKNRRVEMMIIE